MNNPLVEEVQTNHYPMMFHYLLEMHKDGKSLLRLEMNVPVEAFPPTRMHLLLSLESLLTEYGKSQGFVLKPSEKDAEGPRLPNA